jgi:hypothetical protein
VEQLRSRLEAACHQKGLVRFAPEEIIELLTDGETVEWIAAQLLPAGVRDAELTSLLQQLAAAVGSPPDQITPEAGEGPVREAGGQPTEPAAGLTLADEGAGQATDDGARAVAAAAAVTADGAASQIPDLTQIDPRALPPGVDPAMLRQLLASPRGELLTDFSAFCQERGVDAQDEQEGMEGRLRELHDEWLQIPRERFGGKRPAELLEGGSLFPRKVETYRREEPKVQRNDPCPCGSGRKYKKCCGRAA